MNASKLEIVVLLPLSQMRNHTGSSHDKTAILTQILKFESWMGSNVRARPLTVFITWKKKHPLLAFLDKRVGQENTRWVGLCCCCSHFNLSNKFCCWSFCIQVAFQWIGNGMPLTHNIWEIQTWFIYSKWNMYLKLVFLA